MQERLTANSIALAIVVLKGEQGKDWQYLSEMADSQWWEVILWIKRN